MSNNIHVEIRNASVILLPETELAGTVLSYTVKSFQANIWYTQRKLQGIKLFPEKSNLPPEETIPVSPVAPLPRIPQVYLNGTLWYFIFQSPVQANLYWQAILRYLEK